MSEIRMTAEIRTDFDCETTGLPAERWGEAVFKVGDEGNALGNALGTGQVNPLE